MHLLVHFPDGSSATCEQASRWQTFVADSEWLAWCEARGSDTLRVLAIRRRDRVIGATIAHDRAFEERDALEVLRAHDSGTGGRPRALTRSPAEPWFMGLRSSGMLGDRDVATFLSQETRVPTIDLGAYEVPAEVVALLPRALRERHHVLPVSRAGQSLIVAMVDPRDHAALEALRDATGLTIEPVIAPAADIAAALARYHRDDPTGAG